MPIYNTTFSKFKMYTDNVKMKNSWFVLFTCSFGLHSTNVHSLKNHRECRFSITLVVLII